MPDGLRATETAFAYLCLQIWATVDTTIYPSINNHNRYAIGSPDGRELERGEAVEILLRQRETKIGADTRSISCYATRMERRDGLR